MCRNCDTILMRIFLMAKTDTVHTRVTHEIKEEAESIFSKLGLTTSQAIMLFLTASVLHKGLPFDLTLPTNEEKDLAFATAVATVDGVEPSDEAKKLFMLYKKGDIDIETAKFAIGRLHTK